MSRWIVIPRWDEFQHYKDRDPKWIKSHRRQYDKDEYLDLSFHLRGLLEGLRHSYAASNRQLSDRTSTLTRHLGQRVTTRDLEALNHAGFIEFSASKPLAEVEHRASPEVEKEKEKALRLKDKTTAKPVAHAKRTKVANRPSHHDDIKPLGEAYDFGAELARAQAARAAMND